MLKSRKVKDVLFTVAFPVAIFILMELLCLALKGRHLVGSLLDIKTLVRNTGISAILAFALSFNLSCGRFDLSLGAQRLAGTIVGGVIAMDLGLTGLWFLLFSVVFGLLFGFLTGMLFVITRVPPMVLGVGLGLVWECVPYVYSEGKGLNLFGYAGTEILTSTPFTIIIMVAVGFFVTVIMNKTKFGCEMKAIQGSQFIARNSGINIFRHAVLCYTFAGALVCIGGIIDAAYQTQMSATLGLTSNSAVSSNMFAMMLGGYIGEKSNQATGVIVASFTLSIFSYGLTLMELSEANTSVVNQTVFVLFLVFLANRYFLKKRSAEKARIAQALERKKELSVA
jgi:ribose transport system permease protein